MLRDINHLSVGAGWMFEYYHRMLPEHENRDQTFSSDESNQLATHKGGRQGFLQALPA